MEHVAWLAILPALLAATWRMATPLIYASIGEVFAERAGVLNIGLEGIMLIGAFTGFVAMLYFDNLLISLAAAILVGVLAGLIFSLFTVSIKTNQIIVGVAFNLLGLGITGFLFRSLLTGTVNGIRPIPIVHIPYLSDFPVVGEMLFQQNLMVYGTLLLLPVATFTLYKTNFGLSIY